VDFRGGFPTNFPTQRILCAAADLWEASPIRWEDNKSRAEETADLLFPGSPFLSCAETNSKFASHLHEEWHGEWSRLQFIVPSPMLGKTGLTHMEFSRVEAQGAAVLF
jgi:hypothetical protein